ncbi:MAG: sigma-54-dependent Fis family transcriptional regulator [Betaproteobacteria bacterium]|nr:sigma-54-dependent Fis family transcriptional regulator [Betaproteobacteria bacterium]
MNVKRPKILVVDDEPGIRELLVEILSDEGYSVIVAENAEAAWEVRVREKLSLILLDLWMPGKDGLTLLKQWRDAGLTGVPVVVMSGHATIDTAVDAMKLGAREVLEKPIAANRLLVALQKIIRNTESEKGNPEIQRTNFGKTPAMAQLKARLLAASADLHPALLVGAPNSGAMFYAQMLAPPRGETVFIDRNSQLEGEIKDILRHGSGGLIIVRLIDMLNPVQQSGLLALVREAPRAEARIVAGSAEKPETLELDKGFNKSLLDAFSRHIIRLPPLSQYAADIPYTVDLVTRRLTENTDMAGRRLTAPAVELLANHRYENDFLELLTLVRSSLIYAMSEQVDAQAVKVVMGQLALGAAAVTKIGGDVFSMTLRDARLVFEQEYFRRLLESTQGNIQQAVKISGLERTYLYRKLKQLKD